MRFPPPVDDPLISSRRQAATYLGAWGLTATHLILGLLIAIGLLTSEPIVIGVSTPLLFAATCLFIGMVIAAHRRLRLYHGGTTRHLATVWWRGPWDPVGRLIWLPVRLPAAWHTLRHRTSPRRNQDLAADVQRHARVVDHLVAPRMDRRRPVSPNRFGAPGLRPSGRYGAGGLGDGTRSDEMGTSPLVGPARGPRSPLSHRRVAVRLRLGFHLRQPASRATPADRKNPYAGRVDNRDGRRPGHLRSNALRADTSGGRNLRQNGARVPWHLMDHTWRRPCARSASPTAPM